MVYPTLIMEQITKNAKQDMAIDESLQAGKISLIKFPKSRDEIDALGHLMLVIMSADPADDLRYTGPAEELQRIVAISPERSSYYKL